METKLASKFGNSAHIVLPKWYVGRRIKFITQPRTFEDIKSGILGVLKPYLENIVGVYLYGSYARNEQTMDSDMDILVIAAEKLRITGRIDDYSVVSATTEEIEEALSSNAVLILPIIKEAKAIINPILLEAYKDSKFTKSNTLDFLEGTKKILELNKKGLELGFEIGSLVYSLMLRIRGLLMIRAISNNGLYSKSLLLDFLEKEGFSGEKAVELYKIYSDERNNMRIRESGSIAKNDIAKLLKTCETLLKEAKILLK